jgi:putative mRNA 3-end processing factor
MTLLRLTEHGLYCEAGDFHVDPWEAVARAVVTHAHGDHVAWGLRAVSHERARRGRAAQPRGTGRLDPGLAHGEPLEQRGVRISLHAAGHILASAQLRLEHRGEVWVVSGDYKIGPDRTCAPFEPVRCHTFITESTFGLPIYRWAPEGTVYAEIDAWWRENAAAGRVRFLFGYALGKSQRLLAGLDPAVGPILVRGAVERMNEAYRAEGAAPPLARPRVRALRPRRLARPALDSS